MFVNGWGKMNNLYREPSIDASYQVSVIWQAVTEDRIFRNRTIRNKNCLCQPYLLMDRDEMSNHYRGTPIDISYQVSVHLAKRFQRRRLFRNQPIRNKNCLVAMFVKGSGRNVHCNRGLSINVSYPVWVHLAKRFQRRRI
jgi:hypothetical protein